MRVHRTSQENLSGNSKISSLSHFPGRHRLRERLLDVIKQADELIFPQDHPSRGFLTHSLSITICAPTKRPLELMDLPGLIAFDPTGKAGESNMSLIRDLVIEQISKPQSTVLAVVKAINNINNN